MRPLPRKMAFALILVAVIGLLVAKPGVASPPKKPGVQRQNAVAGHVLKATARPKDPAAAHRYKPAKVTWPAAGRATAPVGAGKARAGSLPVSASRPAGIAPAAAAAVPQQVGVQVMDRAATAKAGVTGVLMKVTRTDGQAASGTVNLQVDYSKFRDAAGADWASRLHLVELPDCALANRACGGRTVLLTHNDVKAGTASADVPVGQNGTVVALDSTPSGPAGNYGASSLSPSSSWQTSTQTGDFTWSYPMDVPDAPAGAEPDLGLNYSSGSTDGRTSATNNQVSWVGEGFDYWPGFVERRYVSCSDDGLAKRGDQCWRDDNATMMLNGQSVELVNDPNTGWHPKNDDGSKVERLNEGANTNGDNDGEYWRVTTDDGTQYYFGLNKLPGAPSTKTTNSAWTVPVYGNNSGEPCNASPGWCQQAWRWNLDYVVDTHGNAQSYWYTAETNYYARGQTATATGTSTSYTRGGYLNEIDYGQRSDTLFTTSAPERVLFGTSERCLSDSGFTCSDANFTTANATHWPDTPVDANCASGKTCSYGAPTFWSRKRLTSITTQIYENSAYQPVDNWTLSQEFPGSDGTDPEMVLSKISRKGQRGGTVTLPDVTFANIQMTGRVDTNEGLPPMTKWRISSVTDETGAEVSVSYSPQECVPGQTPPVDNNTKRCFPAYWTPEGATSPLLDWFHKYVVTQVAEIDHTGGAPQEVTGYTYLDTPAWHHDDDILTQPKYKTWGQYRGYGQVEVTHGSSSDPVKSRTDYLYYRGMNGDSNAAGGVKTVTIKDTQNPPLPDSDAFQGMPREEINYSGGGTAMEDVIDDAAATTTASQVRMGVTVNASFVRNVKTRTTSLLSTGGTRTTETDTGYDSLGMVTQIDDHGDMANPTDDKCTRVSYVRNSSLNLMDFPSRTETVGRQCSATPSRPDDVLEDTRTSYDGQAYGVAPTKGDETRSERLAGYSNGSPVYQTVSTQTYDSSGRVLTAADAANHVTKTSYTPAVGGPLTQTLVTDAMGYTEKETLDPAWGDPLTVEDSNKQVTSLAYDPLGRLTGVWLPGRDKTQPANTQYSYLVRSDGPTAIGTKTLKDDGSYEVSYDLYDSQLRPRQTQDPAPGGGRVISDTLFDSRGMETTVNDDYVADGDPSTDLFVPNSEGDIASQTVTSYDEMERPTAEVFKVRGNVRWQTKLSYQGLDRVDITPPKGGTATTEITDALGQVVERRAYHDPTPTGAYDSTTYSYTPNGQLASVTEPSGVTRKFHYDIRDREVQVDDPDAGTSTRTYNDLDQVTSMTDARGQTLAFSYDALGRKTAEYQDSTSGTKLIGWTYDQTPLPDGTLAKGYPSSSTRYVNGLQYTTQVTGYDTQYRELGSSITIPPAPGADSFLAGTYTAYQDFNLDGSLHRSTFPAAGGLSAETMLYGYDELGDPTTLHGAVDYISGTSYNKLGQIVQQTMPANQHQWTRTNTYEDGTNRLLRVQDTRDVAPNNLSDRQYKYDDSGNITKVITSADGTGTDTQCFQYDYLQRITQAWTGTDDCAAAPTVNKIGGPAPYWQSFTYDVDGDRTSETDHGTSSGIADVTHTYTYGGVNSAHPHAVQSISTTGGPDNGKTDTFGYDAAGNTQQRNLAAGAQNLSYDAEGHLATATKDGVSDSYLYDADGQLLIKHDTSGSTLYLPDQEVHATPNGTLTNTRYYAQGDEVVAARTNTSLDWVLSDPQGTGTVAVDTSTQAVTRRYYTPFGQTRGQPAQNWPGQRGFVGGNTDQLTGLVHLGAREYDPVQGRFASVDPATDTEDTQSLNGYAYADNSPVVRSDPSGLWWGSKLWNKIKRAAEAAYRRWLAWKRWKAWHDWWVWAHRQVQKVVKHVKHIAHRISHAWHQVQHAVHRAASHFRHAISHAWHAVKHVVHAAIHYARSGIHAVAAATRHLAHSVARATSRTVRAIGHGLKTAATASWHFTQKHWRTIGAALVFGTCVVASAGACFAAGMILATAKLVADKGFDHKSWGESLHSFGKDSLMAVAGYAGGRAAEPLLNRASLTALRPFESRLGLVGGGDIGRSTATVGKFGQRAVSSLVTQGDKVVNGINNLYNATFTCGNPAGPMGYC
ncbi:MAG: RHS repeat-associated core domain-containing protein [Mycobacteriales bacterium]